MNLRMKGGKGCRRGRCTWMSWELTSAGHRTSEAWATRGGFSARSHPMVPSGRVRAGITAAAWAVCKLLPFWTAKRGRPGSESLTSTCYNGAASMPKKHQSGSVQSGNAGQKIGRPPWLAERTRIRAKGHSPRKKRKHLVKGSAAGKHRVTRSGIGTIADRPRKSRNSTRKTIGPGGPQMDNENVI